MSFFMHLYYVAWSSKAVSVTSEEKKKITCLKHRIILRNYQKQGLEFERTVKPSDLQICVGWEHIRKVSVPYLWSILVHNIWMKSFHKINSNNRALDIFIAWENVLIVDVENHALGPEDFEREKIEVLQWLIKIEEIKGKQKCKVITNFLYILATSNGDMENRHFSWNSLIYLSN